MIIDIVTLFPEMFEGPFSESIIKRAQEKDLVKINIHNLRDWASDKHNTVDDRPYGGGPGMVIKVDVVDKALKEIKKQKRGTTQKIVLLEAAGEIFTQEKAASLSKVDHLILLAGHYEGFDERVREHLVDEVISIGKFVLTGGELPAMIITDAVVRLIPGVLGSEASLSEESYSKPNWLEYPQYTRPEEYNDWKVPEILLSGDHKSIAEWKKKMAAKVSKKD